MSFDEFKRTCTSNGCICVRSDSEEKNRMFERCSMSIYCFPTDKCSTEHLFVSICTILSCLAKFCVSYTCAWICGQNIVQQSTHEKHSTSLYLYRYMVYGICYMVNTMNVGMPYKYISAHNKSSIFTEDARVVSIDNVILTCQFCLCDGALSKPYFICKQMHSDRNQ